MTVSLILFVAIIVVAAVIVAKGVRIVPQQHAWVIERLGRYKTTLSPGLNLIIPIVDKVAYRFDLRENPIDVDEQVCITKDNTQISIDGVLYLQITDPKAAAYGTSDPLLSVEQLAQTVMRSDVGKKDLDEVLSSRSELNASIVSELDRAAINWGVKVLRYEIKNIEPPEEVVRAMELQITAERKRRAVIAESEGAREQAINVSKGQKEGSINVAEGASQAQILRAKGQAEAIREVARATAQALKDVGGSLGDDKGRQAMQMQIAQQFIEQWGMVAKKSTVMLTPMDTGNVGSMVATALKIADVNKQATQNK